MTRHRMRSVLALTLTAYKYCLSPFLPPGCRFQPTCSEYAREAVLCHGLLRGGLLAGWRLARCNPLCKAGHDPVPESFPSIPKILPALALVRKNRSQ